MKKRTVSLAQSYDIIIDSGLICSAGEKIKSISNAQKAVIISDSNVFPLYGNLLKESLEKEGFTVCCFVFMAGERQKTLNTVEKIYEFLCKKLVSRNDIMIALGGGVTGDITGFCAATYLRGIDFVQIPTSLLAQVDSSVGGKTGVDMRFGKNLVGAFYQPKLVLADLDTLKTLPKRYISDGMAEVIKSAAIKDADFFSRLESVDMDEMIEDIVFSSVSIKADIVEADERELGVRKLLNFGHTIGHAIEKHYNYDIISHGEAVSVGMVMILKILEKSGSVSGGSVKRICALLEKYSLPVSADIPADILCENILYDKKRAGQSISIVGITQIGFGTVLDMPVSDFIYEMKEK